MQVTELESTGLKKNFKIVVDANAINSQMEVELRAAGERVKIPGFRPGFIPMKVLQQRYGKSVQGDVLKQVINRATNDALAERKLRPAMTPQINIEEYQEGGDLSFTVTFESFPDVPQMAFDKITLDRNVFDINEEDIDNALEKIAERSPQHVRMEGNKKAELGNVVAIDFKGMIDGVAFEGGTASDFRLELGSKQFIDGFEDQLVGAKEGEDRIVTVTFPSDYPSANLAGKEAKFEVKVKEIYTAETPEVDEAFAKGRGFADMRALREAVRNQLLKECEQLVRNQLKKQLFDALDDTYSFPIPEGMLEMEFNSIWERLKQAEAQGDKSGEGKTEDELRAEYQQIAKRRVKLGILLADIGTSQKIQINRDEVMRAVMQQANMFPGQEQKVMEFYRNNPERVDDLRGPILEEKAVDYILSQIKYNDKNVTVAMLNAMSEEGEEDEGAPKKKKPAKAKSSKASDQESSETKKKESAPKAKSATKKKAADE